jgi:hypothetical protein
MPFNADKSYQEGCLKEFSSVSPMDVKRLLYQTRTVLSTRAFKHPASPLWDKLPADIGDCISVAVFKYELKTYVFVAVFTAKITSRAYE